MRRLRDWLDSTRREPLLRNASKVAGGAVAGHAVVLLALPILSREYTPTELGALGVYTSILSMLITVSMLGLEQAIPLPKEEEEASAVYWTAVGVLLIMTAGVMAVVVAWRLPISRALNNPYLARGLWFLPLSLLAAGWFLALSQWATRIGSFKSMGRSLFTQRIGQVGVQAVGGLGGGTMPLFVGDAVGRLMGTASLRYGLKRHHPGPLHRKPFPILRRYARFIYYYTPGSLADVASRQLPPLLLSVAYGGRVAGFYAIAQPAVGIPFTLLGQAISQAFFYDVARLAIEDPVQLPLALRNATRRLAQVGFFPIAILSISAPWLFPIVLGPQWKVAGIFTAVLFPATLSQFIVLPLFPVLIALHRQDVLFVAYGAELVVCVGAFAAVPALGSGPVAAVAAFSVGMTATYLVISVAMRRIVDRAVDPATSG